MDLEDTKITGQVVLREKGDTGIRSTLSTVVLLLYIAQSRPDGILSQKLPKEIKVFPRIETLNLVSRLVVFQLLLSQPTFQMKSYVEPTYIKVDQSEDVLGEVRFIPEPHSLIVPNFSLPTLVNPEDRKYIWKFLHQAFWSL